MPQACREIDLSLPIKSVEQSGADRLPISRQIVKPLLALAWNAGRRHVEIARKVQRHGAVHDAAHGRDIIVDSAVPIRLSIWWTALA